MPYHDEDVHPAHEMYKGAKSGHQDPSVTGRATGYYAAKGTIAAQTRDITIDVDALTKDEGGMSNKFGKGGPGDHRGKYSDHRGEGDIKESVLAAGIRRY